MSNKNKDLYSIQYVCSATGLSRSGVIKLEEEKLLTPSCRDTNGGNRYYSLRDIARILRIRAGTKAGFTHQDLRNAMNSDTSDYAAMAAELEKRIRQLERNLRYLKIMGGQRVLNGAREIDPGMMDCYIAAYPVRDFRECRLQLMEQTLADAVCDGVEIDYGMPWFYSIPDSIAMRLDEKETEYELTCYVPVSKPGKTKDRIKHLDAIHAFQMSIEDNAQMMRQKIGTVYSLIDEKGYRRSDVCYIAPLVDSISDPGTNDQNVVLELVIPVVEKTVKQR